MSKIGIIERKKINYVKYCERLKRRRGEMLWNGNNRSREKNKGKGNHTCSEMVYQSKYEFLIKDSYF